MRAVLLALVLALGGFIVWAKLGTPVSLGSPSPSSTSAVTPKRSGSGQQIEQISVTELARRISRPVHRPSIVVLYGPRCPISQRMFPQLTALARTYIPQGVDFQAYSTDEDEGIEEISPFLAQHSAPFPAVHVKNWRRGELDAVLAPLGINVGQEWTRPLIVIRNASGTIVAQGQGVGDLGPLAQALSSGSLQTPAN